MGFGVLELTIILFLIFLLLGPKRIVGLFKSLGRGVHDFTEEFGKDKKDKELPEEKRDVERK